MRLDLSVCLGTLLIVTGALGCGDDATPTDGGVNADVPTTQDSGGQDSVAPDVPTVDGGGTDTPIVRPDGGTEGIEELTIGPISASRGQESTVCVTQRLGNASEMMVRAVHASLSTGSHHMIVYRSRATAESLTPTRCMPFIGASSGDDAPLVIAEMPETSVVYPEGAALRLEAQQMIRMEIHYINYLSDDPIVIDGSVRFEPYVGDAGDVAEVQILFDGPTSLSIPARSEEQVNHFARVPGTAARPAHVFAITSHTHQWGVLSTIHRATGGADTGTMLHESRNWAEPPLDNFSPPLQFDGSDGLRLTCNYNNLSDSRVGFGLDFDDEMCFLWAYYFVP